LLLASEKTQLPHFAVWYFSEVDRPTLLEITLSVGILESGQKLLLHPILSPSLLQTENVRENDPENMRKKAKNMNSKKYK